MLKLGMIYNSQGKLINHRSLLKVLVNPFLRKYFKKCIGSIFDTNDWTFIKYKIVDANGNNGESIFSIIFNYKLENGSYIKRERILW